MGQGDRRISATDIDGLPRAEKSRYQIRKPRRRSNDDGARCRGMENATKKLKGKNKKKKKARRQIRKRSREVETEACYP